MNNSERIKQEAEVTKKFGLAMAKAGASKEAVVLEVTLMVTAIVSQYAVARDPRLVSIMGDSLSQLASAATAYIKKNEPGIDLVAMDRAAQEAQETLLGDN